MEKFENENSSFNKDVLNDAESAERFGKSELVLLNLIAEIIVEILMQGDDENK